MKHQLREYQRRISDNVLDEFDRVDSTLVVGATGVGKTVIFADIIQRMQPARAMVLANREELIFQARERIMDFTGLDCDIEMGELVAKRQSLFASPVVISTVQTQCSIAGDHRRMGRFDPKEFGLLILDEAHMAVADTWKDCINYYRQNPKLKVLGVTATPDRHDREALSQIFQSVADTYEILDAIEDGWLVPVMQQFVTVEGLDFSHIRTTAGDLNGADLAKVMEMESNLQGIAGATIPLIGERKTIVFTASVKQAEVISSIFNRHRPGMSDWVCGKTDKDQRHKINRAFCEGELQVVCNCGIYTHGYDNPRAEVCVMGRPTKSRSLYAQMAGRIMRPLPDVVDGLGNPNERKSAISASPKTHCLVIDFVGNSGRHKLVTSADILSGKVSDEARDRMVLKAQQKGGAVLVVDALDEEDAKLRQQIEEAKLREEARKARLIAKVKFSSRHINPFDSLDMMPWRANPKDEGRVLSEKQRTLLMRQSIDPDTLTYAQGKQMVVEMFRRWNQHLCTVRQASVLKKFGYETHDMTKTQATQLLDALAKNRWRPIAKPQPQ